MPDAPLSAELFRLARPHALVRHPLVRREALLALARRAAALEAASASSARPAPPMTVTGAASVRVERRARARRRIGKEIDAMDEMRRLLREETAGL